MAYFIFLCGGKGERFTSYSPFQKPLCLVYGRPLYEWALPSWNIPEDGVIVVVTRESIHLNGNDLFLRIKKLVHPMNCIHIRVPYDTRGAAETLYYAVSSLDDKTAPVWVIDNDIHGDTDMKWCEFGNELEAAVICTPKHLDGASSPYSHVLVSWDGFIRRIEEKQNISDLVTMGGYGFRSADTIIELYKDTTWSHGTERYISFMIQKSIRRGGNVKALVSENTFSLGTPDDIRQAVKVGRLKAKPLTWVFDLDETLLTLPRVKGDYSTCDVYVERVRFVQMLHQQGHRIIIHTARHMVTCKGDVNMVESRVKQVTEESLRKFNIPYDELHFGKPYGDIYVDDKATNPQTWYGKWKTINIGFGFDDMFDDGMYIGESQKRNITTTVKQVTDKLCIKTGPTEVIQSYVEYVRTCPIQQQLFPAVYDVETHDHSPNVSTVTMEWVNGIGLDNLLVTNQLDNMILATLYDTVKLLHSQGGAQSVIDAGIVKRNYMEKLMQRIQMHREKYDTLGIPLDQIVETLMAFFEKYEPDVKHWIHGDMWLSNILWNEKQQAIKFIDMRGRVGDVFSSSGDRRYDLAKLYQSCIGFNHVLQYNRLPLDQETRDILAWFESHWGEELMVIRKITLCLVLGYVPFHECLTTSHKCAYEDFIMRLCHLCDFQIEK